ncbi:hypothetical protein L1D49_23155, partial [Vibrio diabolicus]|nr:hypothetical protein [Vibrio diabolicus]
RRHRYCVAHTLTGRYVLGGNMEQINRVERYLQRIRNVYSGENHILWGDRKSVEDDILSFFIHCHHLHEWVANLNVVGISHKDLKQFIESHESLKICADLANRSKHCRLTKKQWSQLKPHLSGTQYQSNGNADFPGISGKFSIVTQNEIIDVLELAESCWEHWSSYLDDRQKLART